MYILRCDGKNKITGTREFLEGIIAQLGIAMRWSSSKEDFIPINELHDNHLLNCIKEEMSLVGNNEDLMFLLNGPLMKEWEYRNEEG